MIGYSISAFALSVVWLVLAKLALNSRDNPAFYARIVISQVWLVGSFVIAAMVATS